MVVFVSTQVILRSWTAWRTLAMNIVRVQVREESVSTERSRGLLRVTSVVAPFGLLGVVLCQRARGD